MKMPGNTRTRTTPIPVQRTKRPQSYRILTSFEPGKSVPVMWTPLLREDSFIGSFRVAFEMKETVEVLMNGVRARVLTYLVPKTALDRFDGMDQINKSYMGEPVIEGGDVVPWFEEMVAPDHGVNPIFVAMGLHAKPGATINNEVIEAYNQIWNFRARNRSPDIELRDRLETDLAPAFWDHQAFAHIVPDFSQALIDGNVPLSIGNARLPLSGFGLEIANEPGAASVAVRETDGTGTVTYDRAFRIKDASGPFTAGTAGLTVRADGTTKFPDVFAELKDNGITLSLANLDMARKTAAFARLRQQYSGHTDEYIIDLLMDGISVPEQAWEQPILLGDQTTTFGMSKRYATDGSNLTESVVNGMTFVEQRIRVPACPMGGVILMLVEVTPEQMWERQEDPYLHAIDVEQLPAFLRDTLDPEKVQVVRNAEVDVDHDTPNATFGYAPLNHQWTRSIPRVGGKFYRPEVDALFDEDRQRIWAVETQNPTLSADFYLCTTMHQKPFVQSVVDNFECLIRGEGVISGLTVFGPMLLESNGEYEAVEAKQPVERIDKEATP